MRKRLAIAGCVVVALVAILFRPLERMGAHAIVDAPNQGRAAPAAVTGELRVPVGPPQATLSVQLVEPAGAPRGVIFVLHGIRSNKESMRVVADRLVAHGYRAVLVDSRGHGRSTGDWLTYGVQESRDLSQIVDALHLPDALPVGVIGASYGAATALEWAGQEARVRAAVALAPFSSLRAVVPEYAPKLVPLLGAIMPNAIIQWVVDAAGRMGHFDPDQASPLETIGRRDVPLLIFHGTADPRIPQRQSEALAARAPSHTRLVLLDGADHDHIVDDARLWPAVLDFFDRSLQAR